MDSTLETVLDSMLERSKYFCRNGVIWRFDDNLDKHDIIVYLNRYIEEYPELGLVYKTNIDNKYFYSLEIMPLSQLVNNPTLIEPIQSRDIVKYITARSNRSVLHLYIWEVHPSLPKTNNPKAT